MERPEQPELEELLVQYQAQLAGFVRKQLGVRLRRFETVEDLVQGVICDALRHRERFVYQGGAPFQAWLQRVARHYLINRAAYWAALRRDSRRLIRFVERESHAFDPPDTATSPSSLAARREQIVLLVRAISKLRPRDREVLELLSAGSDIEDLGNKLGVSYQAAKQARLRAIDRVHKLYKLMFQAG